MSLPHWREYPDEIKVWGKGKSHKWTIEFDRKVKDWGQCHWPDRMIVLKVVGSRRNLLKTFIHEVLHAMEFENDFEIDHSIVHQLEEPLFRLILDYGFRRDRGNGHLRK